MLKNTNNPQVEYFVQIMKRWGKEKNLKLNIPNKLSEVIDCTNLNLDKLSLMAFEDPSTSGNPKKISKDDLRQIYEHSISEDLF